MLRLKQVVQCNLFLFSYQPTTQCNNIFHTVAKEDHTHNDCFACAILTHGGEGEILYAKDETYQWKELTQLLTPDKCPTLKGKPKLFFVQACRGTSLDDGVKDVPDGQVVSDCSHTIPLQADFLLAHSTCPNYYAWRNEANGSTFIQALCKCLNEFIPQGKDLIQILTRVSQKVAHDFESNTLDQKTSGKKQMPSITTRLRFEVYFPAKN
uniref:Uncharacterized protein LOC100178691 n=1 Tax=Phallusia mammillata TaxID=59560 RepID=A0A6F9DGB9_9ASCI|nr:uncharacterized protein LOC100178691 [Phallusia mammillata]